MKFLSEKVQFNRIWFILFSIGVCLIIIAELLDSPRIITRFAKSGNVEDLYRGTVRIDGITFDVLVADTSSTRSRGLAAVDMLTSREGMLFIFDQSGTHGIWMKDVKYPIDIIWISENFRIVDIKKNAKPESYPEVFRPSKPARYVLEVPAGSIDAYSFNGMSEVSISALKN
jgi:uncharacterized membrane protein (UPF0127 family)